MEGAKSLWVPTLQVLSGHKSGRSRVQDRGVGLVGWLLDLGWLISASLAAVECGWIIIGARKAKEGEK